MDENHQDKTGSKLIATEDKQEIPPLSLEDQRGSSQSQNNQTEAVIKHLRDSGYKVTEEYNETGQRSKVSGELPLRKTWWDWLQLLVIPLALLLIGSVLTYQQNRTNLQVSENQHQADLQIAATRYANDQQLAADQQRETTLQTYLDNMSDLLLNDNLHKSKPGDEVSQLARERTLTILRRLDANRNRIVLQFLQDAQLISGKNAVIGFFNSDLSNDDLRGVNLRGADLHGADLRTANLSFANLSAANLSFANLSAANLSFANLSAANLNGANLERADLHGANLSTAKLFRADLRGADLHGALLYEANLRGANLSCANLSDGKKLCTDLSGASLFDADLSFADLSTAKVTQEQLNKAASLQGTIMPNRSEHP